MKELKTPDTTSAAVTNLSQGVSSLVRGHLALARTEMVQDIKEITKDLMMELCGAPVVLVGYLLLWISVGFLLSIALPFWIAFLICAVANIALGLGLMALGASRVKRQSLKLPTTAGELRRDRAWISALRHPQQA